MKNLDQVLSFLCFSFFVRFLIVRGYSLDVYMPHPGNIFSNYLFFSSVCGKRVFIYEDGILNYYDAVQKNSFVGRWKRALSVLGLMPFKVYEGHLAGYDAGRYDGAFLSMPDLAVRKESLGVVHAVSPCQRQIDIKRNVILFLDQNVSGLIGEGQRQACLLEMFKRFPVKEYSYIYKPHHDYRSEVSAGMQVLSDENMLLPAEVLVGIVRPEFVVSFFSSALINIKNSFPGVSCISLASSMIKIYRDGHQESLSGLFAPVGVECLKEWDL